MPLEAVAEAPETISANPLADTMTKAILGEPEITIPPPTAADPPAPTPAPPDPPAPAPEKEPAPTDPPAPEPEPEPETDDPDQVPLPIDEIETPEETPIKDKAGKVIQSLKAEIKSEWKPKVAELEQTVVQKEARITELQGLAQKAEELETKIADYEKEMSVVRLEKTEAYQKEVAVPLKDAETKIREIAKQYSLDENALFDAVVEPDEIKRRAAIKEATSGMDIDPDDAIELREVARKAQALFQRQDELYAKADEALEELTVRSKQMTEAEAAERAEARAKAVDLVAKRVASSLPFAKDALDKVIGSVKETDFSTLDPQKQAYHVMMGEAFPKIAAQFITLQKEHEALLDELAAYQKASPRVTGGLGTNNSGGDGKPQTDLAAALMKGLGMS